MADDEIIENLKKLSDTHRKHIDDIQTKIRMLDSIPKAQALVGRCFRYPNSYIFGGLRKGMAYRRVIGTIHDSLLVDGFQTEGSNKVEFEFSRHEYIGHFAHPSVVEITEKQYFKAFDKMIKLINKAAKGK